MLKLNRKCIPFETVQHLRIIGHRRAFYRLYIVIFKEKKILPYFIAHLKYIDKILKINFSLKIAFDDR